MAKAGVLTLKAFFPRNGDAFDEIDGEITWECVRTHTYVDGKTGTKIRYALLVGRHPSVGDAPIPRYVDDNDVVKFLRDVDVIHRDVDGDRRRYVRNATGNYKEV